MIRVRLKEDKKYLGKKGREGTTTDYHFESLIGKNHGVSVNVIWSGNTMHRRVKVNFIEKLN